jgi:hypothetical protein
MTIVGLVIVVAQLWREVGPLREEVRRLRNETGRLFVEDKTKLHAIEVETDNELTWKWRVWIPENRTFVVHFTGENIPDGFPQRNRMSIGLSEPGEQVITYRIQRDPRNDQWKGSLEPARAAWARPISHGLIGQAGRRRAKASVVKQSLQSPVSHWSL